MFGFFEGSTISPDDSLQMLARYRQAVPRTVFVSAKGRTAGATRKAEYLDDSNHFQRGFQRVTGRSLPASDPLLLDYVASVTARNNCEMMNFGAYLQAKLEGAGHQVEMGCVADDADLSAFLWTGWLKEVKDRQHLEILNAPIIPAERAKELRDKSRLTHGEQCQLSRFELADFYILNPEVLNLDHIEQDGKGAFRRAIGRLENRLFEGLARVKDDAIYDKLTAWDKPVLTHDLPKNEIDDRTATALGIDELILNCCNSEGWYGETDWVKDFADRVRVYSKDLKRLLGFNPDRMGNCQIVGEILRRYGLKTQGKIVTVSPGHRIRLYQVDQASLEQLRAILKRRAERHLKQGLELTITPLSSYLLGGAIASQGVGGNSQSCDPNCGDRSASKPVTLLHQPSGMV